MRRLSAALSLLLLSFLARADETLPPGVLSYAGDLTPGGMIRGQVVPGASLRLNGNPVAVDDEGRFVLGFDRDAALEQRLEVMLPGSAATLHALRWTLTPRQFDIQRIEGIPQRIMSPSEADLERIRKETELTRQARAQRSPRQDYAGAFIWPAIGPITGVYGSQRIYNGEPRRPHYGLDIAAPKGTLVLAPAGGRVTLAHEDMFYSGGTIIIDHGMGVSSTFLHLDAVLVEEGDNVAQGHPIGRVGATGRATGPHLDWRMNWQDARLDPQLLMADVPMPASRSEPHVESTPENPQ